MYHYSVSVLEVNYISQTKPKNISHDRALSSNHRALSSLLIFDSPGFQNPATCGRTTGASFEDLCHNYAQERLQLLFHETVFTTQQDLYSQVHRHYGMLPLL